MKDAKSVVSLFFPFTEAVRKENRQKAEEPATAWLYGRVEGQAYIVRFMDLLAVRFNGQGFSVCVSAVDIRFVSCRARDNFLEYEGVSKNTFGSNWSERRAAYASGLGTFGLSKGLITEQGMAGRFGSVITSKIIPATPRNYTGIYDNCVECGACIRRCPVKAITLEKGKDHHICAAMQARAKKLFAPRYGCGLCQTGVPCEYRNPRKQPR